MGLIEFVNREEKQIISVVGAGGKTSCIYYLARKYRELNRRVLVTTTTHMQVPEEHCNLSGSGEDIARDLMENGIVAAGSKSKSKSARGMQGISKGEYHKAITAADVVLIEADGAKMRSFKVPEAWEPVIYEETTDIVILAGLSVLGKTIKDSCHRIEKVCEILHKDRNHILTPQDMGILLYQGYICPLKTKYPKARLLILLNQWDVLAYQKRGLYAIVQETYEIPCFFSSIQEERFASLVP